MTTDAAFSNIPRIDLPVRLRLAREHAGLEQSELAERMGAARRTIGAAERGERVPRRTLLMAWAMATGVPLAWIETGEAPSPDGDGASATVRPEGFEPPTFWLVGKDEPDLGGRVIGLPRRDQLQEVA